MGFELDRRQFLKHMTGATAAAFLGLLPGRGESQETGFNVYAEMQSAEEIEAKKEAAAKSLTDGIPNDERLDYLRDHARHLKDESRMYSPPLEELRDVVDKSGPQIHELASKMEVGSHGLFVFADIDREGRRKQRMYVLQKKNGNTVHFVQAYYVSTAQRGFGNENNSEKTPLGIHAVHSGRRGILGEIVSGLNKYREMFNHVRIHGRDHWFVRSFGLEPGNDIAEVVTDQYLLQGPHTSLDRAIRIHGTNRSGEVRSNGRWWSFLGGRRQSGGCIRMSNTDVRDLSLSGYIQTPEAQSGAKKNAAQRGTVVMIHATQAAVDATQLYSDPRFYPRKK